MNASQLSTRICLGVALYAQRQDLPVGNAAYALRDRQWAEWCEAQRPDVIAAVKALQATAFDIALDLGSGGSGESLLQRKLSKGLA